MKNSSISGLKPNNKKRLVALLLSALMFAPFTAASAEVSGDLSSTTRGMTAAGAGTIKLGTQIRNVQAGDMLTAAEFLALTQVVESGKQSVILGTLGNAIGGRVDLSHLGPDLSSLVIPRGVTALQNASAALNLTGNLTNSGNLYLYSTNPAMNTGSIDAANILNNRTGLLSSVLPSTFANLGAITSLNLDLNALDSIINAGIIRSSGALTLTAGNSIVNSGIASVMSATNNINLLANNITNQGLISSALNNINISALNNNSILLNNLGGKLEALLGSINVRDSLFTAKSNFTMTGGDVLSQALNINSGDGIVNVNVKNVLGLVNVNAGVVHIEAATPNLQLGTMNITGDPTFYNTTGDVSISADMIFPGQPLAIVAKGDILTTTADIDINTSDTTGGGAITLIAGANFTSNGPPSVGQPGSGDTSSTLTITGGSTTGGEIDLFGPTTPPGPGHLTSFNSSSSTGAAGKITIIAYKGSVAGTGEIFIPTAVTLNAQGATANGDVQIIAGGTDKLNNAITIGGINNAGAGTGGTITLHSAKPTIVGGPVTIFDGAITQGSFAPGTTSVGAIRVFGATNAGDTFTVNTGGPVTFDNSITADGDISVTAGGTISVQQLTTTPGSNGDISLITTANNGGINLGRDVLADGNVTLQAHGTGSILGLNRVIQTINNWAPEPNPLSNPTTANLAYLLGATVSPDGTKLYVPLYSATGRVYVLDAQTGAVITSITGFNKPQGTAVSPDGSKLFVTNAGSNTVSIVDTATNTITNSVAIGALGVDFAEFVAVSPDGQKIYVLSDQSNPNTTGNPGAAKVSVIDVATETVTNTIPLMIGASPAQARFQSGAIAVNPQGTLAYVSVSESKTVFAIDLGTNTVSSAIDLNFLTTQRPWSLAMDPTGTRVYVGEVLTPIASGPNARPGVGNIVVIDTNTTSANFNKVIANVTLPSLNPPQNGTGSFPQGLSVSPTGTELFAQSTYLAGVSSMYTAPNQVLEFVNVSPQSGPDGYGTTNSASLVVTNGVPHIRLFASNTQNVPLNGLQTLSVIQKPTIQGDNITLTSGGGNIIVNYDAKGGVMTANTGGTGAVLINNVGTVASTVGASSAAGNFFEIGTVHDLTFNGGITSPHVILRAGGIGDLTFAGGVNIGKTGGIVDIRTTGGDMIQTGVGSFIGKTVTLYSATGDIGTLANPILTTTGSMSINAAAGDSSVSNTGILNLNSSAAGGLFSLINSKTLTVAKNGGVLAPDIELSTATNSNANIVINAPLGLNNNAGNGIHIEADGKGNITQGAGSYKIVGDVVELVSTSGNVGSVTAPIRTQTNSLSLFTFDGNAAATNTGSVIMTGFNGAGKAFVVKTDGDLTVNGSINFALNITLQTTNNGDIVVNENIGYVPMLLDTVPNYTKLIAHGTGNIIEIRPVDLVLSGPSEYFTDRGFVRGFFLTLQSGSGNIGSGAMPLKTQSNNINIITSGDAFLFGEDNANNLGPYFMNLTGSTANSLTVVSQGRINVTGALKTPTISLTTLSNLNSLIPNNQAVNNINIGANVGLAGVGSVTLDTTATIPATPNGGSITWTGGSILSQGLNIITDTGSIGTTAKLVKTAVQDLTVTIGGVGNTGNVFITNTGTLDINGITAGGTVKLLNSGALDVDSAISAPNVTLQTSSNGSINLNANVTGTTSVTLNANGTGVIGRDTGILPVVTAPTVSLISGRGNIGSNGLGRIEVSGASTSLTSKTMGSVFLDLPTSTVIGLSSAGSTTGIFDVVSDALTNVSLGGNVSASSININAGADILRPVGSTAVLSGKNINLQAGGTTIGAPGQSIQTKTSNLILTSPNGGAYVSNTGTLTLGEINIATASTLEVLNKGNLTIGGDIFANGSTVNLVTNNGSGTIYQPTQTFTVFADTLNMSSVTTTATVGTGSFGKVDAPIQTAVANFNPSTKGKVFVTNTGNIDLDSAFLGSQLVLTASGDVNINQALTSKSVTINANGGNDILLNANVGATGGLVNLNATGTLDRSGAFTVTGKTANLKGDGGIGTGGNHLLTNVIDLSLSANGFDVFVDETDAVNVKAPAAAANIQNIDLSTGGNLVVASNLAASNTIQLTVRTGSSGSISTTTTGLINAGTTLNLDTDTGNIGTATALVKVNTMNLSANVNALSGSGTVGITNSGSPSLNLTPSSSRGSFTLVDSSGALTVDDITVGFDQLSTKSGLKIVENNAIGTSAMTFNGQINVTGGGIIINNTNVTPGSLITFGTLAQVNTLVDKSTPMTNGNIVIAIGKVPTTGANPGPANFTNTAGGTITVLQTPPGQAFAGTLNTAVVGPAATFNADINAEGRNIIFNSPNANSIVLNDQVSIHADPPGMGTMSTPPTVPTAAKPVALPSTQVLSVSNTTLPTMPSLSNFNAAYNSNVATFFPTPVEVPVTAATADINSNGDWQMGADNIALFIGDRMIAAQTSKTLKASGALKPVSYISNGAASSKSYNVPLHGGGTLYVPSKDTDVETPMGIVHIGKGAAVLVYVQPGKALSVYNLHDEHREDVGITANGHEISVAPGTHTTIASGAVSDFAKVNGLDAIAHRNVRSASPAGLSMFSSEFSITSAMTGLNLLQSMRASNDKAQRDVVDDILKNAAILMQMGGANGGAYQRVGTKASSVTASN